MGEGAARVPPPPGTLIWRSGYKIPPHGWCYPPFYGVVLSGRTLYVSSILRQNRFQMARLV